MWLWALEPLLSVKLSLLIPQSEQSAPKESALSWATRQRHFKQKLANFSIMYFSLCGTHTVSALRSATAERCSHDGSGQTRLRPQNTALENEPRQTWPAGFSPSPT